MSKPRITPEQVIQKAKEAGMKDPKRLLMIVQKEANRSGFLQDGRPKILFEAHKFHKWTNGIYDALTPNISSRTWNKELYRGGTGEWARFDQAQKLNRDAAIKSTSFGLGQILGSNYKAAGCETLQEFVNRNFQSEEEQLEMMISFLKSNPVLWKALNRPGAPDYAVVARHYNGTAYRENNYDTDLKKIYESIS